MGFAIFAVVVVVALSLIYQWETRKNRIRNAAFDMSHDEGCVLCGERELQEVATETYFCRHCDNVQGEFVSEYRELQRRQGYAKLSPEARLAKADQLLADARLELLSVQGELPHVLALAERERERRRRDQVNSPEALSRFAESRGDVASLEQKLADVAVVLAEPIEIERLSMDIDSMLSFFDGLSLRPRGWSVGYSVPGELEMEIQETIEHLTLVESNLQQLERRRQSL